MKKGMLFIDGSNVYHDWNKANPGKQMDIAKYIDLIKGRYPNVEFKRTYYFTSKTDSNEFFLQQISKIPYVEVITGRLQDKTIFLNKYNLKCNHCHTAITGTITAQTDKGTDVNIAVEMLKHAYKGSYDLAVLASRDADFVSVIRIIKDLGCNVELVLFDSAKTSAQELSLHVDDMLIIRPIDYVACEKTT